MSQVDLSVVVVSWNTRELLRRCLESVYETTRDIGFEVVVVDNGSTDNSTEMISRDFPRAVLIRNGENLGFARANNQAILASSGRHVLLLNSDAVLLGDSARLMVGFLDTHPEAGAVGGKLLNPDGSFQSSYNDFPRMICEVLSLTGLSRRLLPSTYPSYSEAQSRETRSVDWVGGGFLMVRHQALEVIGLLDEDYFMYVEEMDWCYRMKRGGWKVFYLPQAHALHWFARSSSRVPERRRAQLYRSKWLFMRKHRGAAQATAFRILVRVVSILALTMWLLVRHWLRGAGREQVSQQVASHRYLLANF